jgi:hypothetical protein
MSSHICMKAELHLFEILRLFIYGHITLDTFIYVFVFNYVHLCTSIYIYVYIYIYTVYIYIYTYTAVENGDRALAGRLCEEMNSLATLRFDPTNPENTGANLV